MGALALTIPETPASPRALSFQGPPMNEDSAPGALDTPHRSRVWWDPKINLGNVLTAIGMLVLGVAAFFDVRQHNAVQDQRISSVEATVTADKARLQQELRDMRADLKDDLKDIRRAVDEVGRRTSQGTRP